MSDSILRSLFTEDEPKPLSVTELNAQVKRAIEARFASVWVEGEIVNFTAARSGHWYFTLHDGTSQLRAACYKGSNNRIRFKPFDGLQVRVRGRLTLYEPRGEYQILIDSLEPVGEGALRVAFEQIRAKLEAEGLFDPALKRPIPLYPRRIAVVTSPTGAAFFDILNVITRRATSVNVLLIPTRVQGETAGEVICRAIRLANELHQNNVEYQIDALIVGRGGGSSEDLWAFNEEFVARAIRASAIPVISAVGHEIDHTIADLAADLRAPTPSAAAEIVAMREMELIAYLEQRSANLSQMMNIKLLEVTTRLQTSELSPVFIEFPAKIREMARSVDKTISEMAFSISQRIADVRERLTEAAQFLSPTKLSARVGDCETRLAVLEQQNAKYVGEIVMSGSKRFGVTAATLNAISPLSVLGRGFSITENENGHVIRRSDEVSLGDRVDIRLSLGSIAAEVVGLDENDN